MIVKSLTLKNFKSYGNTPTRIEFNETQGELILLVGENGAGKTSLLDGLSYVFYNVVYDREQKRIPLKELANRMNGAMECGVEFKTPKVEDGTIVRKSQPSGVKLYEDGVLYGKAGRIADRLQEHVGFDLESYRSFISMSINDFRNFIELSTPDKNVLLDKMFSMDYINQLGKIVKEMKKENDRKLDIAGTAVTVTAREMAALQSTIAKIKVRKADEEEEDTKAIVAELRGHKDTYTKFSADVQDAKEKVKAGTVQIAAYKTKLNEVVYKKRDVNQQLALYSQGKCPTCHTDLTVDMHVSYANTLREKLEKILAVEEQINIALGKLDARQDALENASRDASNEYSKIVGQIQQLQKSLERVAAKRTEAAARAKDEAAADELQEMLDGMEARQVEAEKDVAAASKQNILFKKMTQMFSEDGVKQTIISNIIRPINAFIAENMGIVGMPQRVTLDRAFDAKIMHLGNDVNPQTLSTGEAKIINLCIMLAYIKLIRTRKHINLLFLDEVFASISDTNIQHLLKLLREFARSYNVNVFLAHHGELPNSQFDRILKIQKNVFSFVEDSRQTQ